MHQRKKITRDSIYVIRQFVYVQRIVVNLLFTRKIIKCGKTVFSLKNDTIVFLYYAQDSQWAIGPNLHSIHRLSFRKSLIKNHSNFISGQVIIRIGTKKAQHFLAN